MEASGQQNGHRLLFGCLVALPLLLCSHFPAVMAAPPPIETARDAWPEYQGRVATEVKAELEASGLVPNVFIWDPSASQSGPFYPGKPEDVWLYTDGKDSGVIYEIPRRGLWHWNRLSPGWPNLTGVDYKDAIKTILQDYFGVRVVYGPQGFPRTRDFRLNRVFLDLDKAGKVVGVPRVR